MEFLGGPLFGVAGAGESHGPAITTIVLGCPPGLRISRQEIQGCLDRRRPGSNRHGTPRHEEDRVVLLSGLYCDKLEQLTSGPHVAIQGEDRETWTQSYEEGFSTGEPIAALVLSAAKKSKDYAQFAGPAGEVRPGHTDLVKFHQSKGFADPRGGGRSSYRSTISDVIAGSIARIFLREQFHTVVLSSICQVGSLKANKTLASHFEGILRNAPSEEVPLAVLQQIQTAMDDAEIYSWDTEFAAKAGELIKETRKKGDSLGAAIEVVALNVPPLAGEPLYDSLKLRLMGALGGLHAVQSCEIGSGQEVVARTGIQNNDPIRRTGYQTNHQGGLIGGVTTGMPVVCRVGFKPTSTIALPQKSVRKNLEEIDFELKSGRHDPCVGVRAGVTLESRLAIELMNAVLMHQAQCVDRANFRLF
ncbi:MAG: chorismate synthase [Acidobacteria bacterium]|nr:chorismate synthase [Acidobacteriota bacterium]MCI0620455.1 chorismate synthase [Acidobacteriota bacterium]MCI0717884.1 chorismate synthase [Acidobacteriota bacterium]